MSVRSIFHIFPLQIVILYFLMNAGCGREKPTASFEKISASIYRVDDACNVYVVKRGDKALLIDAGDGAVLGLMKKLGVKNIDWILFTHAHRDQCQGAPSLLAAGAKVAVPQKEERFFNDVDSFWDSFSLYYRYIYKPDTFKPRQNITVHKTLADGETFDWEGLSFEAVETPGHSEGAVSYIAEIDGRRYAFTGDMIHSPGKVWNLYSFDHRYWDGGFIGITANLKSLDNVLAKKPDMLLPSHGTPMDNPEQAIAALKVNLESLYDLNPEEKSALRSRPGQTRARWQKVSEHLYHYDPTSFILLSRDSSALFYDYYAVPDSGSPESYGTIDSVLTGLGIKTVELTMPSHFHEDHVRGFPYLKKRFGTSVWVYENMADILENPSYYNLPCLAEERIRADRVLHDNETIQWKEYEFTIVHFPGQTMYHQGMTGVVDGKKIFFAGDTDVWEPDEPNFIHRNLKLHGISTFLNYYLLGPEQGYVKAMNQLVRLNPEILLMAHSGPRPGNLEKYIRNRDLALKRVELVSKVLPYEDPNLGFDPNWIYFYPYSLKIKPGIEFETRVKIRNHFRQAMKAQVSLRLPESWQAEPQSGQVEIEGKGEGSVAFRVRVPQSAAMRQRTVITAEVKTQDRDWGEFAEMILDRD